ncbi:MAG: beta-ketoacyl-ACP synthase II [Deltaproteobacteria bacterium]|nr:beta-ketoacyl-ACP synthase II [Deltaproteobacteria bacterium]
MRRVVVTGIGLVTPLGIGLEENWTALLEGRSGVTPITRFDASQHRTRFAGEVKGFDPERWIDRRKLKEFDRFAMFSLAASMLAWEDAGLAGDSGPRDRMGCIVGVGIGGIESIERTHEVLRTKGPNRVTPYFIPAAISNLGPGQVAMKLGLRGVNYAVTSACASGSHALGEALRWIQRGAADVMLAGGAEAAITPLGVAGFNAMLALSTRNDAPERASRPFDKGRDGFVMAEGAGILVLEDRDRALARGARVYAELVGYGATDDAHHITQPAPGGEGAQRAMRECLADGGLDPERVGYVNAHGTSTGAGDIQETEALKAVFGDHARRLAVSSTKSMTGHLLGAAGGVEAAYTALALQRGVLPPTINLDDPDPACDLDYVPHRARSATVEVALSNSFGFGGTNATLALARHG